MKVVSWDPENTLNILKTKGINIKDWKKITHTDPMFIYLSRIKDDGTKEHKAVDLSHNAETVDR